MKPSARPFALLFFALPWFCIALCVAFAMMFPAAAQNSGVWILLGSALAFGLPHGACDLWAMQNALRRPQPSNIRRSSTRSSSLRDSGSRDKAQRWRTARWMAAYLGAAAIMLMLWRINATFALGVFLALTVWHFGSADAWLHRVLCARDGDLQPQLVDAHLGTNTRLKNVRREKWSRVLLAWGRGLFVIGAPLWLQPRATLEILQRFTALSGAPYDIAPLWNFAVFLPAIGALLQILGHGQSLAARAKNGLATDNSSSKSTSSTRSPVSFKTIWTRWDSALWLETLALLALFALVPPLLAVACYFLAMHSWRHLLRLEMFGGEQVASAGDAPVGDAPVGDAPVGDAPVGGSWRFAVRAIVRQHRHSLALALLTLLGLLPILTLWPSLLNGVAQWNTAYLVLISAVTVPHVTVVSWLEAKYQL